MSDNKIPVVNDIRGEIGGFVHKNSTSERWYDIGDDKAREEIGQLFRDVLELQKVEKKTKVKPKRRFSGSFEDEEYPEWKRNKSV
mmetsp:Transcript_29866/g.45739  ORF Transcript_29866/g.45739 Transcript_29866/m.45739 type:complete len:85 (+) Transcript_29866:84-338(+)